MRNVNVKIVNKIKSYSLLIPAFAILLLLVFFPIVYNVKISMFQEFFGTERFVGLENYIRLLSEPDFLHSLGLTLKFSLANALGSLILGLIAALVMASKIPYRSIFRVMIFIPWVLPYVVTGIIWKWMLHPIGGIIPAFFEFFHLNSDILSLNNPKTAMMAVLVATIWRSFPFISMMLLAGIEGISEQLYEAAFIDGANKFQILTKMVLPILKPTIIIVVLLRIIWAANLFDAIFIMTGGGPINATETSAIYIYRTAFEYFNINKGAAASLIQLFIFLALCIPYIISTRREFDE